MATMRQKNQRPHISNKTIFKIFSRWVYLQTFERLETSEDFAGLRFREWPGRAGNYDFCGYNLKSKQGGGKFITSLARAKRHHSFTGSTPSFIHCHNCPPFSNTNTFHKCQQYTQMYTKYFLESCYYLFTC